MRSSVIRWPEPIGVDALAPAIRDQVLAAGTMAPLSEVAHA
ncbi:MAG: hypothetical protein M5U01_02230 [Ardenticatenaceae bacterium]|nr:hypothetical protein [Ardenticatenaceae bacterium]